MPIQVTCPGCHTRFRVSDQHAGKQGACPKCGGAIQVPAQSDEVVIHAPEHSEAGARNAAGESVLKPIARTDTKFRPLVFGVVCTTAAVAFLIAFLFRGNASTALLATGAVLLGPVLAWAGYSFLRDPELGSYEGKGLIVRSLACGLVYAVLWGVYGFVYARVFGEQPPETWQMLILGPAIFGVGTFTAYVCYDLEPTTGFFHYGLYVGITVLLRMTMGLGPV